MKQHRVTKKQNSAITCIRCGYVMREVFVPFTDKPSEDEPLARGLCTGCGEVTLWVAKKIGGR
jgi:hypothetical protein